MWLYVLPLIADRGMTFGEAQLRSREMVKSVGWWKTFGTLILLLVAIWVVGLIIALISAGLSQASESAGSIIGGLLFIVFEVVVGPYAICYIATMYMESEGTQPAMAGAGAVPPPPPAAGTFAAPPAPPAPPAAPVTPVAPAARSRRAGDAYPGHHAERAGHAAGHAGRDRGDTGGARRDRAGRDGRHGGRRRGRGARGPGGAQLAAASAAARLRRGGTTITARGRGRTAAPALRRAGPGGGVRRRE